jgi:hypothetical protein
MKHRSREAHATRLSRGPRVVQDRYPVESQADVDERLEMAP